MKIAVFGLGYVGCVSAACLAREGHEVIGVDVNRHKAELISKGLSPIVEDAIPELIAEMASQGRLQATTDAMDAIRRTEIGIVCVGTPSRDNGDLDLRYVRRVAEEIGNALPHRSQRYTIVFRSTVLPGTMRNVVIPTLESASGLRAGDGFGLCYNPEFLREGSSFYDFYHPPKTVIGAIDSDSARLLERLFAFVDGPLFKTGIDISEMVKYTDNSFHALKIAFANEVGRLCHRLGLDSWKVMDIFCSDQKLNISSAYLKPGFAFGGSCLPKDLRAVNYRAKMDDIELPVLNAILPSNEQQILHLFRRIMKLEKKRVGFLGFSFKAGTDDLRESPIVTLIEYLLGKGFHVKIFDRNVNLSRLIGANKEFLEKRIPHISTLMTPDPQEVIRDSEILIISHASEEFRDVVKKIEHSVTIIDLARALGEDLPDQIQYEGISW